MLYYLIIGLQIYCAYHAYKNRNNMYWYFIIFFVPVIGCIIYLLTQVINKRDVTNSIEEITTIKKKVFFQLNHLKLICKI